MAVNGTHNGHAPERLVGVVTTVNPKGIKLEGRDDWFNFSKFAADLVPPSRGQAVSVTLDKSGFVRAIGPAGDVTTTVVTGAAPTKDVTISRLAILKAAAEFGAARPELKSADVLRIAELWEAWVTR